MFYRFEKVPLITPNGDVLIEELDFEVCIYVKLHNAFFNLKSFAY